MKKLVPNPPRLVATVLASFPGTMLEIATKAGVSKTTVFNYMVELYAEKKVFIRGYVKQERNGRWSADFALGSKADAVPPDGAPAPTLIRTPPIPKKKCSDEELDLKIARDIERARKEALENADRMANNPDSFTSCFFSKKLKTIARESCKTS